jgi:predicted house-cleaning NTP pyrophosphatase (Maf/HAM1 superfamily)
MTRKNLDLGSAKVITGDRMMTVDFKVYGKAENNVRNTKMCYYYGYKAKSI